MNINDIDLIFDRLNIRGNGKTREMLSGLSKDCIVLTKNYNMSVAYESINPFPQYVTISDIHRLHGNQLPIIVDHEVLKDILRDYLTLYSKYLQIVEVVKGD